MLKIQRIAVLCSVVCFALMAIAASSFAQTSTWEIDPAHSTAQFTVRHMGISNVTGNFTKVSGTVLIDDKDIAHSQVTASIDANSVDTRVEMRDKDLRSDHFFDVEKYPTIDFKSKSIRKNGDKLTVVGDLTIHGTTHEVSLDVDGPSAEISDGRGNTRRGFSATTSINRKEFGLAYNNFLKTGEAMIGETVKIQLDVELVKKK